MNIFRNLQTLFFPFSTKSTQLVQVISENEQEEGKQLPRKLKWKLGKTSETILCCMGKLDEKTLIA